MGELYNWVDKYFNLDEAKYLNFISFERSSIGSKISIPINWFFTSYLYLH